jgi:16S rRNA (cytidine1402-2'-O)-methyltransferase
VCRELTKTHEEVRRGTLADLVSWAADGVRGEVTLVVAGAPPTPAVGPDPDDWRAAVASLEASGTPRKSAISQVAHLAAVPKRLVYDAVHKPPPVG